MLLPEGDVLYKLLFELDCGERETLLDLLEFEDAVPDGRGDADDIRPFLEFDFLDLLSTLIEDSPTVPLLK